MIGGTRSHCLALRLAQLALGLMTLAAPGCEHDAAPYCRNGLCACWNQAECDVPCRHPDGCVIDCASTSRCSAACADDCLFECTSSSSCSAICEARCAPTCISVSDCDLTCGEQCDALCEDVSACRVAVGPGSHVECNRVSSCEVRCDGPCTLDCPHGGCELECAPGLSECEQNGQRSCMAASC